jgi:hypothetical protein
MPPIFPVEFTKAKSAGANNIFFASTEKRNCGSKTVVRYADPSLFTGYNVKRRTLHFGKYGRKCDGVQTCKFGGGLVE